MQSVPFEFVQGFAAEFGAVECYWRESDRSFTGFVTEVWFAQLPSEFVAKWAAVMGYSVLVGGVAIGPGRFAPCNHCSALLHGQVPHHPGPMARGGGNTSS